MDLINKAFLLCNEIEARQAELRDILNQIALQSASDAEPIPESGIILEANTDLNVEDKHDYAQQNVENEKYAPKEAVTINKDLLKSFTINDRFRFRRELFGGDDIAFIELVSHLSTLNNYTEAEQYIATLSWDSENDAVVEFKNIVSTYFNGYKK